MSVCNLKSKIIFIHQPKCCGTSMESREFIGGGGYQDIEFFRRVVQLSFIGLPEWDSLFKFGFVRNPYDRFASAFIGHYADSNGDSFLGNKHYSKDQLGFSEFIKDNEQTIRGLTEWGTFWQHFIPQYVFLTYFNNESKALGWKGIGVDFVGRFENLKDDWKYVCDKVGVSDELPHLRNNGISSYDFLYTEATRKIVEDIYKEDFRIFNYEMNR